MTIQDLNKQHRQYAINELRTVDFIYSPTETQVKAKMDEISRWPWFQSLQSNLLAAA